MLFYKSCLGGTLYLQTVGETPLGEKFPDDIKEYIVHACLQSENMLLMATDMVEDQGLTRGNAVSILIQCESKKEISSYYKKLSAGGESTYPVQKTYWGALFGALTDKYGNRWLLNLNSVRL